MLSEKVEVIRLYEKGGIGTRKLADDYSVGKTQIVNILKRKQEYLDDNEKNTPATKKRNVRNTGNESIHLVKRSTKFCAKKGLSTALYMLHDLEGHLVTIWSQEKAQLRQASNKHFFSSS